MRVHLSHSPFYCSQTLQLYRTYLPIIYTMHLVPIPTSRMLAYIHNDCCRGTGEGQTEEEEDTKEGQQVETTSGRPRRADWHL